MVHEATITPLSSFITLTYDDEHLPYARSLVKEHLQKFFKKLRSRIEPRKIRYYAVGEYGSTCSQHQIENCPVCGVIQRPHYHAIVFGFDFPDKKDIGTREGNVVYESELLHSLWPQGFHEIGNVSFESCAYVARYVCKKQTGARAAEHYCRYIPELDAWADVDPEFAIMSRRPGIGADFYDLFSHDMYPSDELTVPGRGVIGKPPAYYDKLYERENPEGLLAIKEKRIAAAIKNMEDGPSLSSREKVKEAQFQQLKRQIK